MIKKVLTIMRQVGATALLATNSVAHITPLLLFALVKFVVRVKLVTRACDRGLMGLAASWISVNSWMMAHLTRTKIEVTGLPERQLDGHFLVISNHQSWVDIPVLQRVFNCRLPMLRFFLKSQLIWVPMLGLAWWALDFPFMKRYSREQIAKRPELAGKDLEATQRACDKFANIPVSVVNFVEGTRFRASKQEAQGSDFTHLLKPRAGGTAFVLNAMGETLDTLVDVTIAYPNGRGELMDLFANRIDTIRVHIQTLAIPKRFRGGDYHTDPVYRAEFQAWLNDLWAKKDQTLTQLLT